MNPPDPPLLQVRDLVVEFALGNPLVSLVTGRRRRLRAVDEVSFTLEQGQVLGIVGESGSGKTTIGKTVLRLNAPTSGEIVVRGQDIATLSPRALKPLRRSMQMVFQDPLSSLNPRHSVRTSLTTPLKVHRLCRPSEIDVRVDEMLSRVGLPRHFRTRFPHELSGGQLQRVAIGRALMLQPSFIVADEAVSKLDVSVRAQILNLFKDLQETLSLSILFVTHDLHVARFLCQRIMVMYFGQLVEEGSADALFRTPRHPYTIALLGTLDPGADASVAGEAPDQTGGVVGCQYYGRCTYREDRCAIHKPPLEETNPRHSVACFAWERVAADREPA